MSNFKVLKVSKSPLSKIPFSSLTFSLKSLSFSSLSKLVVIIASTVFSTKSIKFCLFSQTKEVITLLPVSCAAFIKLPPAAVAPLNCSPKLVAADLTALTLL